MRAAILYVLSGQRKEFPERKLLKSLFPPLGPDLKPRKKWDTQWTCPRQPEAGTKFGAERIQGLWSLVALGGGLRDSKRPLGPQHFMGIPHTPPLLPTLNRGWKGGERERDTQKDSHCLPLTLTPPHTLQVTLG